MRRRLPILLLALVLLPSASASATTPTHVVTGEVFDPLFAGDRVVWQERGYRAAGVRAAAPGGPPAVVADLEPVSNRDGYNVRRTLTVAASPIVIALVDDLVDHCCPRSHEPRLLRKRVLARTWPDPLVDQGPTCSWPNQDDLAVAGPRVAFMADCRDRATLRVRDLQTDATTDIEVAPPRLQVSYGVSTVRMAGDLVAWVDAPTDGGTVAIRGADLATGEHRTLWTGDALAGWDLRADGALALVRSKGRFTASLSWVDPSGTERPLPGTVPRLDEPRVRIAGDQIAVELRRGHGRMLALVGLEGTVRPVALLDGNWAPANAAWLDGFDFDGTRLTWAAAQCEEATIWALDVAALDAPVAGPARRACREARVDTEAATVGARGRFAVDVSCVEGCAGVLEVRGGGIDLRHRFELGPSWAPQPVRLRLPRHVMRRWRDGEQRTVRLSGRILSAGDRGWLRQRLVLTARAPT